MSSKCCLCNRNNYVGDQIVFFASIGLVLSNAHVYIQIPCTTTTYPHSTPTTYAQCLASVDSGRHFHGVFYIFDDSTITPARSTRSFDDLTHSTASATRSCSHHLSKHALTNATHLPGATTLRTSLCGCSFFGSATFTFVAPNCRTHFHFSRASEDCFFKRDISYGFNVLTTRRARLLPLSTPSITGTKWRTSSKKCFKDVAESACTATTKWVTSIATTANSRLTKLVIARTLVRIRKHFVCVRHFFKFGFGFRISRVCVWVQFASTFAVCALYFIGIRTTRNAKQFIKICRHGRSALSKSSSKAFANNFDRGKCLRIIHSCWPQHSDRAKRCAVYHYW